MTDSDAEVTERRSDPADGVSDRGESADAAGPDGSLRTTVVGGLRWSFLSQITSRALSFGTGIVLFRLLVPDDFGVYAFALAVMSVLLTFNDVGLDITVIRYHGDPQRAARAGTAMTIGTSTVTYLACFLAAPVLAELAQAPDATNQIRLMATVVLIDGIIVAPRALLFRAFRQRELGFGDMATAVVTAIVAATLAALDTGAWAPTVATVVGAVVNAAVILHYIPRYPWPTWDPSVLGPLFRSGILVSGAAAVELLLLNADSLLAANMLGPGQLAFYALAFNVSSWPVTIISQAVRRVSISGFATLADEPQRLHDSSIGALRALVALVTPISVALAVLAEPLVEVLYSPKSLPAAPVLSWLALVGATRVLAGLAFDVLVGTGRQSRVLGIQVIWLVIAVPALWLGARLDGILGMAAAHAIVALVVAVPVSLYALRPLLVRGLHDLKPLYRWLVAGAAGAGAAGLALWGLESPLGQLLVGLPALGLTYLAVAHLLGETRTLWQVLHPQRSPLSEAQPVG